MNLSLTGIGGVPASPVILLTTTNVAAPAPLWELVETNAFDGLGVFVYTNRFRPTEPGRFFRLGLP